MQNVVLVAADRHRSDAWEVPREKGYTLYEFQSSKLTNVHTHGVLPASLFGINDNSFGLIKFDTKAKDPEVTYRILDIEGKEHHSLTLKLSQLSGDKK